MEAIRERIQPAFRDIGQEVAPDLTVATAEDVHVHIAQHSLFTRRIVKKVYNVSTTSKKQSSSSVAIFRQNKFINCDAKSYSKLF
jgi:uncharacterized protein YktB (UPF0637 family)